MNIIRSISSWNAGRIEKKINEMKDIGNCPDCKGNGFITTIASYYTPSFDLLYDCPGCNGTGQYSEWEMQQNPM
ncbi:methionine aminopeptidase [Metabacillus malikii]|uniref:DnaJ-class molecular chaperone n=1 Tax=Metabacillus malikii TaxID=1504265 RepID=A0ABT9ZAE3_9BACI|nr:methionine aminopeptidase [Metabacillus malikii]MDQ0228817.1 DnaJ-class molecular chaperone [Metabacillus malikii]